MLKNEENSASGRVQHHAVGNLKHHRVRIAHDQRMPDVPWQTEVVHERGAHQQIAEKRCQDGRPDDGMKALDVEQMDRGR